ncbi:hypothetical protein GYMLUDRAFT_830991 [Collybiopsis luxurians FD-317 M1]|uniref:Uncharacterized protein n=1 Tax=Collybiopsis luxurians FD-317 M1 TaxID=944289 RepID=A0A0D0AYY2_9AGAR|nr:hypothetical protein GYMLUDRAFT_830991 [Collybiopsis luxurians FD-317 M1]
MKPETMNLLGIPSITMRTAVGYFKASPTLLNAIQHLHKLRGYDPKTNDYVHSQGWLTFCFIPGYGSEMVVDQGKLFSADCIPLDLITYLFRICYLGGWI